MKKFRIISLLMVLVVIISMIPMAGLAASSTSSSKTTTSSSTASKVRYVKTANGLSLNVRSSRKTHTDNIIAHLDYGTKVTVLKEYKSWAYISWSSSTKDRGYVVLSALSKTKPSKASSDVVYKYTYNPDGNYVNLRSAMKSHTNNVITSIRTGTKVSVIDTYSGGWSKVKYGSYTGYIQSKYLTTKK